eukprot:UN33242
MSVQEMDKESLKTPNPCYRTTSGEFVKVVRKGEDEAECCAEVVNSQGETSIRSTKSLRVVKRRPETPKTRKCEGETPKRDSVLSKKK